MFNVTVLKMRDIVKYLAGIAFTIIIVMIVTQYFGKIDKKEKEATNKMHLNILSEINLSACLDKTLPAISELNEEYNKIEQENEKISENNYLEMFLETEISSINGFKNIEKQEKSDNRENNNTKEGNNVNTEKNNQTTEQTNLQLADSQKSNTEIVTPNPIAESYNVQYQNVKIKNQTTYNLNVVHDTSYHDYPSYTGSYTRSLNTVENILKTTTSDIIIDLHRDAIGSRADYAPTVKIGEDYAAQIMFVIGTNEGGLWHPNWNQNLKFAVKIQQKAEEMYPGLFKPIMLTKSRYNQHTGKYANIIEVGATGNTLEQCLTSMKYLSAVINEVLN